TRESSARAKDARLSPVRRSAGHNRASRAIRVFRPHRARFRLSGLFVSRNYCPLPGKRSNTRPTREAPILAQQPLDEVHHAIVTCERCPRLRAYCQRIGREKRRGFLSEVYW